MFKSSEEFQEASEQLLKLVEKWEKGELTDEQLFQKWKWYRRAADAYLQELKLIGDKLCN